MVYYVQHYLTADNPIQEGRIVVRYNWNQSIWKFQLA